MCQKKKKDKKENKEKAKVAKDNHSKATNLIKLTQ
jgi:hypothetical protein